MKIVTKNVLLAFMGFLHFKSADGMDPNDPEQDIDFPENRIIITMDDGCTATAHVGYARVVPSWIQANQAHPEQFVFYIREPRFRLSGIFGQLSDLFERHDPTRHIPRSAQIHIRTLISGYFLAGPFEVYPVQEQQGPFPPENYIYVAVPHGQVYRASLRPLPYKKGEDLMNMIYPGMSPKRGRIIP